VRVVKTFRACAAENLSEIKEDLSREVVTWRRLSHQNVLPVLGISSKLFPSGVGSEWIVDGNIKDFTLNHPEVNRLRFLAEAARGLHYLHSMGIVHGDFDPTSVVVDRNPHPHPSDSGLIATISDRNTVDPSSMTFLSADNFRYMGPELLDPEAFGLAECNPTRESDIYAFGVVTYQVVTGEQPFPGAEGGPIVYNVISGERPSRPSGPNEWVSDDLWNFICRCWSPSWDGRPDVEFAINALNDAADTIETRRRNLYVTQGQGNTTSRSGSGASFGYRSRTQLDGRDQRVHPRRRHSRLPLCEATAQTSSRTVSAGRWTSREGCRTTGRSLRDRN